MSAPGTRAPATHDYTRGKRGWGHDYTFSPKAGGAFGLATGWGPRDGPRIEAGDYLLLEQENPPPGARDSTRYLVRGVEYFVDPPDMWKATLEFAPRLPATDGGAG